MGGNPQVLGLLEQMLDSGKTPEEVCRDCPELLPEVWARWQEFQLIDGQIRTLLSSRRDCRASGGAATRSRLRGGGSARAGRHGVRSSQ